MWVPLVENNEINTGADYFIKKNLDALFQQGTKIDVVLLACTHYPLLKDRITRFLPVDVKLVSQGELVAASLAAYLQRHPEIAQNCSKHGAVRFFTTDDPADFDKHGALFFDGPVTSTHVELQDFRTDRQ